MSTASVSCPPSGVFPDTPSPNFMEKSLVIPPFPLIPLVLFLFPSFFLSLFLLVLLFPLNISLLVLFFGVEFFEQEIPRRKKRVTKDMSPDQKRNVYLDRNKEAASKCRQKKKVWFTDTQSRMDIIQKLTDDLRKQSEILKKEQNSLLEYLVAHKNCGSDRIAKFLEDRERWEREIMSLQVAAPPQFSNHLEDEDESGSEESGGEE